MPKTSAFAATKVLTGSPPKSVSRGPRRSPSRSGSHSRVGQAVPDFALTDHKSDPFTSTIRRQGSSPQFVYTRCLVPNTAFVPPTTSRAPKAVHDRLARSCSPYDHLDPVHDQPEILREYSKGWKATRKLAFLTGTFSRCPARPATCSASTCPGRGSLLILCTRRLSTEWQALANLEGKRIHRESSSPTYSRQL